MPFRCNCGKLSCSQRMIPNCHKSATFILKLFCPRTKNQSQSVKTTIVVMTSSRPWWVCTTFSFLKRAPTKICGVFFGFPAYLSSANRGPAPLVMHNLSVSNQSRQLRRNAIRRRIFRLHTNRLQETPKKPDPQCQPQPKCARIVLKPTCAVLPVWDQVSIMDDLR